MSSKEGQDTVAISRLFTKTTRFHKDRWIDRGGAGKYLLAPSLLPFSDLFFIFPLPSSPKGKKNPLLKGLWWLLIVYLSFNQLDLPAYETYDKLRSMLNKAVDECPEGFGLA